MQSFRLLLPASTPRIFSSQQIAAPPSPAQVSGKMMLSSVQYLYMMGNNLAAIISF